MRASIHIPCKLFFLSLMKIFTKPPCQRGPPWQAAAVAHCYDNSPCPGLSSGGELRGCSRAREKKKQWMDSSYNWDWSQMVALIQHIKNDISVSVLKAPMIPWSIPWPINYKGHWNSGSGHWLSALKEYTTSHYRDTLLESKPELLRIFIWSWQVQSTHHPTQWHHRRWSWKVSHQSKNK